MYPSLSWKSLKFNTMHTVRTMHAQSDLCSPRTSPRKMSECLLYSSTSLIYVASGRLIVLRCLQLKTLAASCLRPKVLSRFMVLGCASSTLRFKMSLGYTFVHILSFETPATTRTHLFKTIIVINCRNFFFCISKMSVKIFDGKKKNKLLE